MNIRLNKSIKFDKGITDWFDFFTSSTAGKTAYWLLALLLTTVGIIWKSADLISGMKKTVNQCGTSPASLAINEVTSKYFIVLLVCGFCAVAAAGLACILFSVVSGLVYACVSTNRSKASVPVHRPLFSTLRAHPKNWKDYWHVKTLSWLRQEATFSIPFALVTLALTLFPVLIVWYHANLCYRPSDVGPAVAGSLLTSVAFIASPILLLEFKVFKFVEKTHIFFKSKVNSYIDALNEAGAKTSVFFRLKLDSHEEINGVYAVLPELRSLKYLQVCAATYESHYSTYRHYQAIIRFDKLFAETQRKEYEGLHKTINITRVKIDAHHEYAFLASHTDQTPYDIFFNELNEPVWLKSVSRHMTVDQFNAASDEAFLLWFNSLDQSNILMQKEEATDEA
jgi:hypothetical protein